MGLCNGGVLQRFAQKHRLSLAVLSKIFFFFQKILSFLKYFCNNSFKKKGAARNFSAPPSFQPIRPCMPAQTTGTNSAGSRLEVLIFASLLMKLIPMQATIA